jgi:cytochrome c peroxidase
MKPGLALLAVLLTAVVTATAGDVPWSDDHFGHRLSFSEALAMSQTDAQALIDRGRDLFSAKFTAVDGAGRPKASQAIVPTRRKRGENPRFQRTSGPDSSACVSCHNDPVVGGAGDFVANAFVSEGFESADFDSVDPQFSSERNTNTITGDGMVELLAREMTAELQAQRRAAVQTALRTHKNVVVDLASKGVSFGSMAVAPDGVVDLGKLEGIDTDLVLRPFSRKGVFTSLRQFTVNALNAHHGMQAAERFGVRWTGTDDFDGDGKPDQLTEGDVSALTIFQATLAPPGRRDDLPATWKTAAEGGEKAFGRLGCAACHRPTLPLKSMLFTDPGPYDIAGTLRAADVAVPIQVDLAKLAWARRLKRNASGDWLVPLFSDLKRHVMVDPGVSDLGNELMAQRFVERDVFMTAELWGVGSTAPYGHRGDLDTLDAVIRAHGGEARAARDAYVHADDATRSDMIAFLKTLVIAR